MPRDCQAPDHDTQRPHRAYARYGYFVVVYPRKAAWYFACEDHLIMLRHQIAMGQTQLRIMKWWGGKVGSKVG